MSAVEATQITAEWAANRMWGRSRPIVVDFTASVIRQVVKERGALSSTADTARLAISRFQVKSGRLIEAIVAEEAGGFLRGSTSVQVKTKRDDRVPFDVCFTLPRLYVACSITTIPQERKDDKWPGEEAHLRDRRRELAGQREILFAAIFVMGRADADLEQTRRVVQTKQRLLLGGKVLALQDVESTAEWLRDVLRAGV